MGLEIFRDSKVESGRKSSFFFLGFCLGSNFDLYSKEDFLMEMTEVGNGGLTEVTVKTGQTIYR